MGNGAHGDLFPVRYLKVDTPVNWIESNEPLQDLEANVLVLDGKLATTMSDVSDLGDIVGVNAAYLSHYTFGNDSPVGAITADVDYPAFGGDFEILYSMASTAASGRVDLAFQGKIPAGFTTISNVSFGIKGTGASPEYLALVYVEGSGASPVYDPTSGTPIAAPGPLGTVSIGSGSLSAQPNGDLRFFVVVEAYVDASEAVLISNPYVTFV